MVISEERGEDIPDDPKMFANFYKDDRILIAKIDLCQIIPNSVDQAFDFVQS